MGYDLNGNVTSMNTYTLGYDVENRTTTVGPETYVYDPGNLRIEQVKSGSDTLYFYGPGSQILAVLAVSGNTTTLQYDNVYVGGMLVGQTNGLAGSTDLALLTDRLGSVNPTYPYGARITTYQATTHDFATYTGDSATGFDYAVNRWETTGFGRFLRVDPDPGSATQLISQSFNRFSYGLDDPINAIDPLGTDSDDCDDLLAKMNRYVFGDNSGFKGLIKRFAEQISGMYPPGTPSWDGHDEQIIANQNGLIRTIDKYEDQGCGDPPPSILGWALKDPPKPSEYKGRSLLTQIFGAALATVRTSLSIAVSQLGDTYTDLFDDLQDVTMIDESAMEDAANAVANSMKAVVTTSITYLLPE